MWNVVKKFLFFGCFIIVFCFINIVGVKAAPSEGYAQCNYDWENYIPGGMGVDDYYVYRLTVKVYTKKDNHGFDFYKTTSGKYYKVVTESATGDMFNDISKFKDADVSLDGGWSNKFYVDSDDYVNGGSKVWKCPSFIYVSTDDNKIKYSFSKKDKWKEVKCTNDENTIINQNDKTDGSITTSDFASDVENNHNTIDSYDDKGLSQDIQGIIDWGNYNENKEVKYNDNACLIIKGPVQQFLNTLFIIISVISIILLIVMSVAEFIKVITGSDEDGIKTAFKHTLIRAICIVVLLILPMLIGWVLDIVNDNFSGKYEIGSNGEPLCEIGK